MKKGSGGMENTPTIAQQHGWVEAWIAHPSVRRPKIKGQTVRGMQPLLPPINERTAGDPGSPASPATTASENHLRFRE